MTVSAGTRISLVPGFITDDIQWKRGVAVWAKEVNQGHLANTGLVSLTSGVAATVVTDARLGVLSCVGFMPTTANAAAEIGNGTMYVSSQSKGAFTITHANGATGDRTFRFSILG